MGGVLMGTCSWNYDSWVGLVYSAPRKSAADYLGEYAKKYPTVEIDSWFYRIPARADVEDYLRRVPEAFRFTCKASEEITLTHRRNFRNPKALVPNGSFLSTDLFRRYADALGPMLPRVDALILEFEYLNREKMPSLAAFLDRLGAFVDGIGGGLPIAIEARNANYLTDEYFSFLDEKGLMPVFSEKLYLPPVYEVYEKHRERVNTDVVIRLLGGDRTAMEEKTGKRWDRLVESRPDKGRIADMSIDIAYRGHRVVINVNNHYEGSAPLTIRELEALFAARGVSIARPAGE